MEDILLIGGRLCTIITAACGKAANFGGVINCAHSTDQIQVKMKRLANKLGQDVVLLPPPPEKIVFMKGFTPTMKDDALMLYDTNCSNLCMTDDILARLRFLPRESFYIYDQFSSCYW